MATFRDPRQLASHQRTRASRVRRSMDMCSREQAELALKEAKILTSGTTAQSTLTAAGHPFRKDRLRGIGQRIAATGRSLLSSFPLLPINQQSGALLRGWRIFTRFSSSGPIYRLQNIARNRQFVLMPGGTKHMVDRGFWAELNRRVLPKARRMSKEALKRGNGQ